MFGSIQYCQHKKYRIGGTEYRWFQSSNSQFDNYCIQMKLNNFCREKHRPSNHHPKNRILEHKKYKRHSLPMRNNLKTIHIWLGIKYKLSYLGNESIGRIGKSRSLNKWNREKHKAHKQILYSNEYLSKINKWFSLSMSYKAIHKSDTHCSINSRNQMSRIDI